MKDQAKSILKNVFGYEEFRPFQEKIIEAVLKKDDALVIMPTGGGKSLCYQIPAIISKGITVVVSPLLALMKDQIFQLTELNVDAVSLNSSLSYEVYQHNIAKIRNNETKLVYVAPETLLKPNILSLLSLVNVECFAIDESHCISEWGHDFRPEYRQLAKVISQFKNASCIALTATATPRVRKDIKESLCLKNPKEIIASFDRKNLFLEIIPKQYPRMQTIEFLKKHENESGIIYCFSRRQVDELSKILDDQGFSVLPYHAGLSDKERIKNQELFIKDDVQIIVATIAFGMGINKPNVRFVVHYDLPKNIEVYYQEIGRAGRDGLESHCLLLFGYGDIQKIKYFIDQKDEKEARIATIHINALLGCLESEVCRRTSILNYFGEINPIKKCGMCDNCVTKPEELIDVTIPTQKFLSCIKRTGEMFGAKHIIDILHGSKVQKVLKSRHDNLSTYGIGKEYSKKQWYHLSRQFLQKGLLTQDLTFGSLKLTKKAYDVLRGGEIVKGRVREDVEVESKRKEVYGEYDKNLFEILRKKRKAIADAKNIPPYAIFPDKTLIEMSIFYPLTKDSLNYIYGVGLSKLEHYGDVFLELIKQYCKKHNIEEQRKMQKDSLKDAEKRLKKLRYIEVGELFNKGKTIFEIMSIFSVKQETIINHLSKYITTGNTLRSDFLLSLSKVSVEQRNQVFLAFDKKSPQFLTPVFEMLNGKISYDELKILRLSYLVRQNSLKEL